MSNVPEEGEGFGAYCLGVTSFRFVSLSKAFHVLYVSFSGVRCTGGTWVSYAASWELWGGCFVEQNFLRDRSMTDVMKTMVFQAPSLTM